MLFLSSIKLCHRKHYDPIRGDTRNLHARIKSMKHFSFLYIFVPSECPPVIPFSCHQQNVLNVKSLRNTRTRKRAPEMASKDLDKEYTFKRPFSQLPVSCCYAKQILKQLQLSCFPHEYHFFPRRKC